MLYSNGTTECPTITSGFGPRAATGGASSYHRGADSIGYRTLCAVESGIVRCSGSAPDGWAAGGDQVWIQHDGCFSKSLHQAESLVSDGQWVNEGDPIGIMGDSGSAQGVHQHLEITPGELHFGNYGQVDPLAYIAGRLTAPTPAAPTGQQRRTIAVVNGRAEASSQSALTGDPLQPDAIGNFVGWAHGESVEGNDVWFQGTSGRWFWSGGFDGGPNTKGLPDLTPAPALGPQQRRTTTELNGRADATVNAEIRHTLPAGTVGDFDGWKNGDAVGTETRWVRGAHSGDWFSLAYLEPRTVDNLPDLNAVAPSPTPAASNERTVGAGGANGRTGPGRTYPVAQTLDPGTVGTFDAWTHGESVEGIDIWFRGALAGRWFWAGGFTSQATDGLTETAPPTAPPVPSTTPTGDNPLGLATYQPFYPDAVIGLRAPLGDAPRGTKGTPPVPAAVVIDQLHLHRTGSDGDDGAWFSTANSRDSCPHLLVLQDGRTREYIRPRMKPALTGPDWNWRGYGIEIQGAGNGTAAQFERVADIMAWLASYEGRELDGVPVTYNLRQRAGTTLTHREMVPTECPGPWWQDRVDALIERARVILAERYATAPTPDTDAGGDVVEVPRSKLLDLFGWLKGILGKQS